MKIFSEALRILYSPATPEEFPAHVHHAFAHLLPAICVSYDEFNVRKGVLHNEIDRKFPLSDQELLDRWANVAPHHPGVAYYREGGKLPSMAVSSLISQRQLRDTILYQDFWKWVGVKDQLFATIPIGGDMVGVAVSHDAVFSSEDVFLMELVQPHFVQAYQNSRIIGSSRGRIGEVDFTPWRRAGLTQRECEVLLWVMEGKRNSEIAIILAISPRTAKVHVERILAKLGVETRAAAGARARDLLGYPCGISLGT